MFLLTCKGLIGRSIVATLTVECKASGVSLHYPAKDVSTFSDIKTVLMVSCPLLHMWERNKPQIITHYDRLSNLYIDGS
jgi:hypothetical protein